MPVREPDNFVPTMTPSQCREEVMLIDIDNIRKLPISDSKRMDFYSLWNRFGPQAGRDILIPMIYYGYVPRPSEYFSKASQIDVSSPQ